MISMNHIQMLENKFIVLAKQFSIISQQILLKIIFKTK